MQQRWQRRSSSSFGTLLAALVCMAFQTQAIAQQFALPLDDFTRMRMYRAEQHRQPRVHSGMEPVFTSLMDGYDSDAGLEVDTARTHSWFRRKLLDEHFVVVNQPGLQFTLDPLFNFSLGNEFINNLQPSRDANPLYVNTRGFALEARVGEAVYVYSDFTENQARLPGYVHDFVLSNNVVPGSGRVKPFGEGGWDYNMASAFVGVNASKWLVLQAGHHRHFVGHGMRSLLLSDNAFNYPFAGYLLSFWEGKVQLRNHVALMQSLDRLPLGSTPESLFKRKYQSVNYLSFKPVNSFEIGFFEAVQWQYFKEGEGPQAFEWAALNPVIFTNTIGLGLDNPDHNAMVGVNAAWQFKNKLRLYGQYMRDSGGAAQGGYQLGLHAYGIKDRFDIQLEYNDLESNAYASENALQGFHHFAQALAHPLGSGFREGMAVLTYYHKRMLARVEFVYANFQNGRLNPVEGVVQPVGAQVELTYLDTQLAYIFNEKNQMQVYAGFTDRTQSTAVGAVQNHILYLGMRSRLQRSYRNF